ncbi:MAG: hypothetical protein Q3962_07245 [Corynebacterium sp.]|nr:hypothetical protein [Corynebacterium sp.]
MKLWKTAAAFCGSVALILGGSAVVHADTTTAITDATFLWGLNQNISSGKPPAGNSNYMIAGTVEGLQQGDSLQSKYKATDGNVSVVLYDLNNQPYAPTWETRTDNTDRTKSKGQFAKFTKGTGTINADKSVDIKWTGSLTIASYGGMVPFWITNPHLHVNADGSGELRADLGGYQGVRGDATARVAMETQSNKVVATFSNLNEFLAGSQTLSLTPNWSGVVAPVANGNAAQAQTGDWGSWPTDFVEFQNQTGLSSYYYSSGGEADKGKKPLPISLAYATSGEASTPAAPETPKTDTGTKQTTTTPATPQDKQEVRKASGSSLLGSL